ncbi:hypothetical protein AGMMS49975_28660 [Clostridia bacterium]|nr:hypothetical protein AGMMS49975_28660 [Clostridia bacterium]
MNNRTRNYGFSKTEFLIRCMSDKPLMSIKDIDKILAELKRQGNNLNQAMRYANETGFAVIVSSQSLADNIDYAEQFQNTAKIFGKGKKQGEQKYYSLKLSCDPKDEVTPEQSHKFAENLAKKFFPDNECVIATHNDTNTVQPHIIVNSVICIMVSSLRYIDFSLIVTQIINTTIIITCDDQNSAVWSVPNAKNRRFFFPNSPKNVPTCFLD